MAEQKIELRKIRDFSDVLNDTFLFIKQNFKPLLLSFLGIGGVFMLAAAIVSGIYQSQVGNVFNTFFKVGISQQQASPFSMFNTTYFLLIILSWLNYIAMQVSVVAYLKVYEAKAGETPTMQEVWEVFKQYFFQVFIYSIPIALLTIVGIVLCILPGIWLAVVFAPFPVVIMVENATLGEAFNRCFSITKQNFWISLVIYVLVYVIAAVSGSVISLVIGGITGLLSYLTTSNISSTIGIVTSVFSIFSFIFFIIYYVALCLQYFNLVEKHDGTGMMRKLDTLGNTDQPFNNTQEQY